MNHFQLSALTEPISSRHGMTHAVLQSIYNHAESTQNDQARMESNERGGTWSNAFLDMVGARSWTLQRAKLTDETLSLAQRFYEEALAWLVNEGHAKSIVVTVWREKPNQMGRNVMITLSDGTTFDVPLPEVNK